MGKHMAKTWFVKSNIDGKVFGPYSRELLQKYLKEGKINQREYAISTDSNTWHDINVNANANVTEPVQQMIGKYRITKELGRGGMGIVFQAEDTQLQRKCALKVLLPELRGNANAVQRFQSEAKAVAQIQHPGIIQIYEICQSPQHFFAMAYVEGQSFSQYITNKNIKDKLKAFYLVCDAIEFAHSKNIVHRDLKPENILVGQNNTPVILDFGIAKHVGQSSNLTKTGDVFGTPKYMSPEAAQGQETDQRSDIYSLGVILYEILTGTVPFTGENPIELLFHLTTSDPTPPSKLNVSIPRDGDLEVVCLSALAKDPKKRIANAAFLKSEIDNIIHKRPIKLKPPTTWQKFAKWRKKNPMLLTTITTLLIISCAAIFAMRIEQQYSKRLQAKTQKQVAESKISAIYITLEAIDAEMAVQNIFKNYRKITDCYRYLYEIIETIPQHKAKDIYEHLNMHLRFDILSKFPVVIEKQIPESSYIPVCSPQSKYIVNFYQEDNNNICYVWKNLTREFTKDNVYFKIPNAKPNNSALFSPNNKYMMCQIDHTLTLFDLDKREKIFAEEHCYISNAVFSTNSRYCGFRFVKSDSDGQAKYACHLLDLSSMEKKVFPIADFNSMHISPNEEWFVIHSEKEQKLIVHNTKENTTYRHEDYIFKNSCNMCFGENRDKIFIVSIGNMGVFDLKRHKLTTSPTIMLGGLLSSGPTPTTSTHFAIGKRDGHLILAKRNDDDSIFQQRLPSYFNVRISHLAFEPEIFLTVVRNDIIELREMYSGDIISTFTEDSSVNTIQLRSQDGLKIGFTKRKSYREYTIPFDKLRIESGIKRIFSTMKNNIQDADLTLAMIADKDVFIYTGRMGFLIWRNEQFFHKFILDDISSIKYDPHNQYIFARSHKGKISIYDARDASLVRNFNTKIRENTIFSIEPSKEKDEIYISHSGPYRIIKENLRTNAKKLITTTPGETTKILVLGKDTLLIVCKLLNPEKYVLYLVKPGEPKIPLLTKINFGKIVALATDHTQSLFAIGDNLGNIYLWKASQTEEYQSIKVNGEIRGLSFSPTAKYLAVTVKDNVHVYNTQSIAKAFEMYRGFYKEKGVAFSDNWEKAYIPDGVGEIMVFNQAFLVNDDAMFKKIKQCDTMIQNQTSQQKNLTYYIEKIAKKLNNTK